MNSHHYDLVVIGSGPAGQKGAIAAGKLGKRVAIVDREVMIGGVCLNTGTIPNKTLREATRLRRQRRILPRQCLQLSDVRRGL